MVEKRAQAFADTRPARENFIYFADKYAARIAAETIFNENPRTPDLSDEGIISRCAFCVRHVRPSEASMVREAYIRIYG